jgi:hypothetical protein
VSLEQVKLAEANDRVLAPGVFVNETGRGESLVWLIVFEGDWQVIPPDPEHTVTPPAPTHGCVYVIEDVREPGWTAVGTIECPP